MKKGQIFEGIIEKVNFPSRGIIYIDGEKVIVRNVIEGQKIKGVLIKNKRDKKEGRLLETIEKAPNEIEAPCKDFGQCGGCLYQSLKYENQLNQKVRQVKDLFDTLEIDYDFEGIVSSPKIWRYRNKMEYSFGDEYKEGPLVLGLHKRNSMHDIVETSDCQIVHDDFNEILKTIVTHFREENVPYYHKRTHQGYLRYVVLRKGEKTNNLLVNIVTSSQMEYDYSHLLDKILDLKLEGKIVSIIHTINDSLSDAIKVDDIKILHGQDYFYEEILGLKFKISPFSFFQTNTLGAEKLYSLVREYVGETKNKVVFDLYSGTGTITQMLAPIAKKAVGVEIVEEAVEAAKENAKLNNLTNCEFIAGDVLKVIDELEDRPDIIVLDPPRSGIHPKALPKIIDFGVNKIVYVSCKPTSLVKDLKVFIENGYKVEKVKCVDMFPHTVHVETVVLMSRVDK